MCYGIGFCDGRGAVAPSASQILARPDLLQASRHGELSRGTRTILLTRTTPMAHLSCWIGLDDSTIENGCVHYVPRSHQWELLPITGLANDMNSIQTVLSEKQQNEFQPVPIELKKGEASFHHPLMVHGSFANMTERPRRAIVINAFADGVLSDSNEPPLAGVPAIPRSERMQGQFFPLLFDPAS